jgi:hypothetical protein
VSRLKTPGIGVHPRHHLQRLGLDAVATPRHRQRFEFAQGIGRADFLKFVVVVEGRREIDGKITDETRF